jgi:hypothetical protein
VPPLFLAVLLFWLTLTFASFGLFAPRNATVLVILIAAAVSVAGAVFLVLELDGPFDGLLRVSPEPLRLRCASRSVTKWGPVLRVILIALAVLLALRLFARLAATRAPARPAPEPAPEPKPKQPALSDAERAALEAERERALREGRQLDAIEIHRKLSGSG